MVKIVINKKLRKNEIIYNSFYNLYVNKKFFWGFSKKKLFYTNKHFFLRFTFLDCFVNLENFYK